MFYITILFHPPYPTILLRKEKILEVPYLIRNVLFIIIFNQIYTFKKQFLHCPLHKTKSPQPNSLRM